MNNMRKNAKILNVSTQLRNFKNVTSNCNLNYNSLNNKKTKKLPSVLLEQIYYILNIIYNMNLNELMKFSFSILMISKNDIHNCTNVKSYKSLYNSYEQKIENNLSIVIKIYDILHHIIKEYTTERFYLNQPPYIKKENIDNLIIQVRNDNFLKEKLLENAYLEKNNKEKSKMKEQNHFYEREILYQNFLDIFFYKMENPYAKFIWFLNMSSNEKILDILDINIRLEKSINEYFFSSVSFEDFIEI